MGKNYPSGNMVQYVYNQLSRLCLFFKLQNKAWECLISRSKFISYTTEHDSDCVCVLIIFLSDKKLMWGTECPKKHGNSVTNWISSLLWISIVIPNFKSHNIIMSARVYFIKRVKDCKDVSIMSPQDELWRRTSLLCLHTAIFLF